MGKTTLATRLAQDLNLPLIPELAREICRQLGNKQIGEIEDQEGFKRLVLEKQIATESGYSSFVADRSAIDCWVLWQRWNICQAMSYDTEAVYERVRSHVRNYSHIVYVPVLIQPEEDGFRWTDPDYIKQIDRIIRTTFYDLDLWNRVLTLRSEDLEGRLHEVKAWLAGRDKVTK